MCARIDARLKILPLPPEDSFKDIARLGMPDRGQIREGSVCIVTANGHAKRMKICGLDDRDLDETQSGVMMLDEITRKLMGVTINSYCHFTVEEAGLPDRIKWAFSVPYRGTRISAWIGIVTLALGLLGALLAVIGFLIAVHPFL